MTILALGYLGIGAADLDAWQGFAAQLLGMEVAERTSATLSLRMDERMQRVFVESGHDSAPRVFGWEVANASALDRMAARIEAAGFAVRQEPAALADRRAVSGLVSFDDPLGHRFELFHGARSADRGFVPGRRISGFRTGALGLGHAVIVDPKVEQALPFYRDVLGFAISDYVLKPFKAWFFHVNARHHSFALIESPRSGLHHFMVEHWALDDVGQAYDIALQADDGIGQTLGRHTNDFVTSFYANSPSGFMVEVGWGGRLVTPGDWQASEMTDGPSLWGHDRYWLPPDDRARARQTVLDVGQRGVREPVQVIAGNHHLMPGRCPWLPDHDPDR
ncbi:MAG: VOC family protein [Burkholderiaceae bacterium]